MRELGLLFLTAGLSALLSGCDGKPARTPTTAPYTHMIPSDSPNFKRTADPIRAELYIYKEPNPVRDGVLFKRKYAKFAYVGKPWVFEFPGYAYSWLTDAEGGPQGGVYLEFEPETMKPMWLAKRERFGWDMDKWPHAGVNEKNSKGEYVAPFSWSLTNQLFIEIYPINLKAWKKGWPDVLMRTRSEWNKYLKLNSRSPDNTNSNVRDPHGKACGADWYRAATTNPNDPNFHPEFVAKQVERIGSNKIEGVEFSYPNLQGYVDDEKYGGISLWCDGSSNKCGQDIYLPKTKMFGIRLSYPMRYACQYREIADKVDALFAKHTISYPSFEGGPK